LPELSDASQKLKVHLNSTKETLEDLASD